MCRRNKSATASELSTGAKRHLHFAAPKRCSKEANERGRLQALMIRSVNLTSPAEACSTDGQVFGFVLLKRLQETKDLWLGDAAPASDEERDEMPHEVRHMSDFVKLIP